MKNITFEQLKNLVKESWQDYENRNETVKDILNEMRQNGLEEYADRIEAAKEREHQKVMRALKDYRFEHPSY